MSLEEAQQAKVFEKFERLGRSGDGGSGLGLSLQLLLIMGLLTILPGYRAAEAAVKRTSDLVNAKLLKLMRQSGCKVISYGIDSGNQEMQVAIGRHLDLDKARRNIQATVDEGIVATWTTYGDTFASTVWRDNVFATQFHPEKSQDLGLQILKNFAVS